jgi:predicted RNA binding protein YcfA (HicA-like mRNA interferase family)
MARQVGSHRRYVVIYVDEHGYKKKASITVAQHPGDMPCGMLRAIERDLEPAFRKGWLTG